MKKLFQAISIMILLVLSSCYKQAMVSSDAKREVVLVGSSERQNLNSLIMKYYLSGASDTVILIEGNVIVDIKNKFYILTPRSSISLIKRELPIYQIIAK